VEAEWRKVWMVDMEAMEDSSVALEKEMVYTMEDIR
jgi:hypothetical protein